jgi:hypothetical protein
VWLAVGHVISRSSETAVRQRRRAVTDLDESGRQSRIFLNMVQPSGSF